VNYSKISNSCKNARKFWNFFARFENRILKDGFRHDFRILKSFGGFEYNFEDFADNFEDNFILKCFGDFEYNFEDFARVFKILSYFVRFLVILQKVL
jgi:hypothetical protein